MKRTVSAVVTVGTVILGAAACGGSSSPSPAANAGSSATAGTGAAAGASPGTRRGFNRQALAAVGTQLPAIRTCLDAAGLSTTDLPTAVPTAFPTSRPSGAPRPSFNPSDRPTARPSGGFGRAGGFGGIFTTLSNPADQAALKACGITVPALGAGRGPGSGFPGPDQGAGGIPSASPAPTS